MGIFSRDEDLENFSCGKSENDLQKENDELCEQTKLMQARIEHAYKIENESQHRINEIHNLKVQLDSVLRERDKLKGICEFLFDKLQNKS